MHVLLRCLHRGLVLMTGLLVFNASWALSIESNAADVKQLDSLKGLGLKMAARIVDERRARGPYKDWLDLVDRVKGIGEGSARRLSDAGLTVNGAPFSVPPLRPKASLALPASHDQQGGATSKPILDRPLRPRP